MEEDEDAMFAILSPSREYDMFRRRGEVLVDIDGLDLEGVDGGGRKLGMQRRARRVILGARAGTEVAIGGCHRAERRISGARELHEYWATTQAVLILRSQQTFARLPVALRLENKDFCTCDKLLSPCRLHPPRQHLP